MQRLPPADVATVADAVAVLVVGVVVVNVASGTAVGVGVVVLVVVVVVAVVARVDCCCYRADIVFLIDTQRYTTVIQPDHIEIASPVTVHLSGEKKTSSAFQFNYCSVGRALQQSI